MDNKEISHLATLKPCSLSQILGQLTKEELTEIRQYHEIPNLSKLKKNELIVALIQALPRKVYNFINQLDKGRYQFLRAIVQNEGVFAFDDFNQSEVNHWSITGFVFHATINNKEVLVMPQEILKSLQAVDHSILYPTIERNTEWILLSQGMLYYYGVLTHKQLWNKITELTGKEPAFLELHDVLWEAQGYYNEFEFVNGHWVHHEVLDSKKIYQEQQSRQDLDYARFSKSKLHKAGNPGYRDEDSVFHRFKDYLLNNYKVSQKEAKEITYACQLLIKNDVGPTKVLDYLGTEIEFPTFVSVQELMNEVTYLSNHTRQWTIKGHSPDELFDRERKEITSLTIKPFNITLPVSIPPQSFGKTSMEEERGKVIDFREYQKVGRNAPCPCGSGKKYKHCCGK